MDLFSSTNKNDPSYFGNLSFVVHLSNKTRIGCANFTNLQPGSAYPSAIISGSSAHPSANISGSAHPSANISGSAYPAASTTSGSNTKPTEKPTYDISGPAFGSKTAASPSASQSPQFSGNAVAHGIGGSAALLAAAVALIF